MYILNYGVNKKEDRMNKKLNLVFSAIFMVAGVSFLAWTIYDTFFK